MSASGLNKAKLKTTAFSVRVETQYKASQHIFVGYVASHRMRIDLPIDKILLNKILSHVAQGHSGAEIHLTFSVRDKDALRQQVFTQAVSTDSQRERRNSGRSGWRETGTIGPGGLRMGRDPHL